VTSHVAHTPISKSTCATQPPATPVHTRPLPQDEALRKLQRKTEGLEGLLAKHPLAGSPTLHSRLDTLLQKQVGASFWLAGGSACHGSFLLSLPACPSTASPAAACRTPTSPPTHCTPTPHPTALQSPRTCHPPPLVDPAAQGSTHCQAHPNSCATAHPSSHP
jgi:hypothetical protein